MPGTGRPDDKIRRSRPFAQVIVFRIRSRKLDRGSVASEMIESIRTGPRVLVACDGADRFSGSRRVRTIDIAPKPVSPYRSVDVYSRAIPMTEEEVLRRNAGAIRALDEVAEMGGEQERRATLEALMTSIDEEPLSSRRRFR
jgi:hypothetical protein